MPRYEKGFADHVRKLLEKRIASGHFRTIREIELYKRGMTKDPALYGQGIGQLPKKVEVWYDEVFICDVDEGMSDHQIVQEVFKQLYYKLDKETRDRNSRSGTA